MRRAKVVPIKPAWHQSEIIGAHADHSNPLTPRQQSRYSGELVASPPPFKPSCIRDLIGALAGAVIDYANRPYARRRSF